jgi:hypothetical protein
MIHETVSSRSIVYQVVKYLGCAGSQHRGTVHGSQKSGKIIPARRLNGSPGTRPEANDPEIACGGPLPAREGQFVLKYFLLRKTGRRPKWQRLPLHAEPE